MVAIARDTGLPLRLREIGSSGGLNLRPDAYWYEQDGSGWGAADSTVRFVDLWPDGVPPFATGAEIIDRRGCDRDPIDAAADGGALTLLSYIWPEPEARFTRARDAMEIARATPVADRPRRCGRLGARGNLPSPRPGAQRSCSTRSCGSTSVRRPRPPSAPRSTRPDAARLRRRHSRWLRLEPHPETYAPALLQLTLWDGRVAEPAPRLLATTGFHGGVITWLDHAAA